MGSVWLYSRLCVPRLWFQQFIPAAKLLCFSKYLNGHEVGCDSLLKNNSIMIDIFANFDLNKYKKPNYTEIDLRTFDLVKER